MAQSIYRRLSGKARGLGGYSELWLAPDHILLLKSSFFRQTYQRFALADIQAVVITEEPSRTPMQLALAMAAILWMLIFFMVTSTFAKGFFLVSGALALQWVIIDFARGPRCRCHLHTAVSRELLRPISRSRAAAAFLLKLQPAIEAVQGAVPSERLAEIDERGAGAPGGMQKPREIAPEIVAPPSYLPEVVFGMFLINALLLVAAMRWAKAAESMGTALPTTLFCEFAILMVALFRRGSRDPRRFIYIILLAALVGIGWDLIGLVQRMSAFISSIMVAAQRNAPPPALLFTALFDRMHSLIAAEWRTAAGIVGLGLAFWERRKAAGPVVAKAQPETAAETVSN